MGSQEERTVVVSGSDCPMWDASMQFQVKDLVEDTLCITVFDKGYYSPDGDFFQYNSSKKTIFYFAVRKKNDLYTDRALYVFANRFSRAC